MARLFLAGKDDQVLTQLIARMEKASQSLEFEEAARIRDQIQAVRRVTEKQFVSNTGDDLDVIGVAFEAGMACVHVLFIRQGKVLGSRSYFPKVPGGTELGEVVETFVGQFYLQGSQMRTLPGRFCSTSALVIRRCWPSRCRSWRDVESMCRLNRAATERVTLSWRAPTPRRR
ncbi:UvrB/UvrC motif-containing protein [Klebsiella variicola subsp. variicola]|nr:UvrB/UvrC motif-containing protein [Klebsiella variicola subsp. variicola]